MWHVTGMLPTLPMASNMSLPMTYALPLMPRQQRHTTKPSSHSNTLNYPADSFRRGGPDLILRNSIQGGIYEAAVWCNPGEKGMIYLKAFEITKGTPLSVERLKMSSNCIPGWSDDPQ